MAIVFDCPHCGTHYSLKDEVGGKTATCKNPNCRKVIPIPKAPQANGKPAPPAAPKDLDAFAAAAFLDEPTQAKTVEAQIEVTCAKCDHKYPVDASKEGKNVLCPECRHPNRVPLRKKVEKADWRTGTGPTLAKRETGLDREGAFGTAHMGGISDNTAREIVKSREAEEEPEERRKKWLKRGLIGGLTVAVLGIGGFFLLRERREGQQEARMEEAVKEVKEATKDSRYHALILRASAEHRIRTSESKKETDDALNELKLARNILAQTNPGAKAGDSGPDRNAILAHVAVTMGDLLGTSEQVSKETRLEKSELVKDLRITVTAITDPDLAADVVRALTRKFAQVGQPTAAEDLARQLGANASEAVAQIGLELLRVNPEANRSHAEELLKRATGDAPGLLALRLALGHKQPAAPPDKKGADTASAIGTAEAEALRGNVPAAAQAADRAPTAEERTRAYVAAAQALIDSKPADAGPLLDSAATQAKGATLSLGLTMRLCRLLARAGKFDVADSVATGLPEDARAWARLEILRGRLANAGNGKADDSWLPPLGDPTKAPAAAKGHEEVARHNAANGIDYQGPVQSWPTGIVQPFGRAGITLGLRDRK